MTEGVIAAWHKKVGDPVKKGDLLAEIETDKATMELESYQDGTILHLGGDTGAKLQVNDLLCIIGKQGEDVSALVAQHAGGAKPQAEAAKPEAGAGNKEAVSEQAGKKTEAQPEAKAPASDDKPEAGKDYAAMEEIVLMPRLSDTMTEGVIAAWHKNVGDAVKKGEVLAEIETDKATMELESYKDGTLLYQGAKAGEKIQVNDLLCIIGQQGFDVDGAVKGLKGGAAAATKQPTPQDSADQQKAEGDVSKGGPAGNVPAEKVSGGQPAAAAATQVVNEGRIFASPLAKKLAEEKGIDLKYVQGSGDNGRITKSDIENFKQPAAASNQPSATSSGTSEQRPTVNVPQGQVSFEEVPVSQMRKVIAKRLAESKFTAPHFYLTMSIDMDAAVAARGKLNEVSKVKISFNDLVLKAAAVALKQHPKVNSSWLGDKIRINHHVNIGVAVAVEEGLLVPVVRFADGKSLSQIAVEVKDFAQKAKDKKLQPADWEGSTFTISNLGMFGIEEFTAIINPPDACILAVGGIAQVPVVKNGNVVAGNVMKLTLSCDHRVVDGATGAAFLQTLKGLLEEPLRMLV